jgi:TonB-dependent receptor
MTALFALAMAGVASAQTATPAASTDVAKSEPTTLKEVVVTSRRKALQSATERKRNSDTVIDSIVADEAGKLPDTSITEVLQRVSGVTITRFASLSSPDQYSFEGSGIQVRGLSGVTGLLNGREIFSANQGNGLNWGDVTPELMAGVDVYKASTSDLIEGGTGGAVDLRTKMPFDYKKPELEFNITDSYGTMAKHGTPQTSILLTDRWQTPIGEFGALLDLAYAQYKYADSFIRSEPYYPTTYNGQTVYAPGGFDYGNDGFDRTRKGLYTAFQWRPTNELTIWQTDFVSNYHQTNTGGGVYADTDVAGNTLTNATFNKQGIFTSGTVAPPSGGIYPGNSNNYTPSDNTTADFSEGFIWNPTNRLKISGAFQTVISGTWAGDYGLGVGAQNNNGIPSESLNLKGSLPRDSFSNPALVTDPTQAGIDDIIWNNQKNHAQMLAGNFDVDYDLGDGFFKKVKAGVRYADRRETDDFIGTYWAAVGRGWNGDPQLTVSTAPAGDFYPYQFPNFFQKKTSVPSAYYFASQSIIQPSALASDLAAFAPGLYPNGISSLGQLQSYTTKTTTFDAYLKASFGHDKIGWLPAFTGNIGVRLVHDTSDSIGEFAYAGGTGAAPSYYFPTAAAAAAAITAEGGVANALNVPQASLPGILATQPVTQLRNGKFQSTHALPSLNVAFKPDKQWVVRIAVNQTLSPPNYYDIRAYGTGGVTTSKNPCNCNLPGIFQYYNSGSGDPELKPAVSTNEDLSVEWYPSSATTLHADVFNKSIKDLIIYNDIDESIADAYGLTPYSVGSGGVLSVLPGSAQGAADYNAGKTSTILGAEIGGRTYFDKLPGALRGFGVEANYTYIDDQSPSALAFDMNGDSIKKLPIVGLSKTNFNFTLLYDLGNWDARLAYSYRSKYLATTTGNGTTGSYSGVNYSLPVYAVGMGQLDGGIVYKVNNHLKVSLDVSNILNNVAKTEMEIFQGTFVNRSWFINDQRVVLGVHTSF